MANLKVTPPEKERCVIILSDIIYDRWERTLNISYRKKTRPKDNRESWSLLLTDISQAEECFVHNRYSITICCMSELKPVW